MGARIREFVESIVGADRRTPRWLGILVAVVLLVLAFWYALAAVAHGKSNNIIVDRNDQRVYINYARSFAKFGVAGFTSPRMRMPAYGWLLSFSAAGHVDDADDDLLARTRIFNVGLSLVCLAAMYAFLRRWLDGWFGLCFILVAAFQLYLLRAAYVQPELLLTTLITATIAQLIETLRRPAWWNAVLAGVLLCLWFLTKASAQGALGLFGLVLIVKWLTAEKGRRMPFFIAGVLVLASYLLPMSPYLYTSWKIFGSPFYNAQSKYYMWAESNEEKHALQKLNLDFNLDKLPADRTQLPSAAKYLHDHSLREIEDRIWHGTDLLFRGAFDDYGLLYFMLAFWAGAVVWGFWRRWPEGVRALWRARWEALFVAGFLTIFSFLFGWFTPIHVGPRLIISITLAALFVLVAAAQWLLRGEVETLAGVRVSLQKLLALLFLVFWSIATLLQAAPDLALGFFGG